MREYSRLKPAFWLSKTGRAIKAAGLEVQVAAFYLMTAPSSNMIGFYYLPISTMAHETGLTIEGASKALQVLIELGFARYDYEADMVWVCEMAAHQMGETMKPTDKQLIGAKKLAAELVNSPLYKDFHARYRLSLHLPEVQEEHPIEGASKGLPCGIAVTPIPVSSEQRTENREERQIPSSPSAADESEKPPSENPKHPRQSSKRRSGAPYGAEFEAAWAEYPKHEEKAESEAEYLAAVDRLIRGEKDKPPMPKANADAFLKSAATAYAKQMREQGREKPHIRSMRRWLHNSTYLDHEQKPRVEYREVSAEEAAAMWERDFGSAVHA